MKNYKLLLIAVLAPVIVTVGMVTAKGPMSPSSSPPAQETPTGLAFTYQGQHVVSEEVAELHAQIQALEERLTSLESASLEKGVGAGLLGPGSPTPWLLLGGLSLVSLVLGRRWYTGIRRRE